MDAVEPPAIVIEETALCSDEARAEELARRAAGGMRAPGRGWTLRVRFEKQGLGIAVTGVLEDPIGGELARRELHEDGRACAGLARAVVVWASLVLDAEVDRARRAEAEEKPAKEKPKAAKVDRAAEDTTISVWPAPVKNERPPPQASALLQHDEAERSLEIGASGFIMGGTGTGAIAGPEIFAVVEIGHGIFLRPLLAVGRTIEPLEPSGDVYGTWGAMRLEACLRVPGLYLERRGMQLEGCLGNDVGFLHFDALSVEPASANEMPVITPARTIPFFAFGPAIAMRGELGSDLSVVLRGVAGVNLVRESFFDPTGGQSVDPPLFNGRAELALSWSLR